MYINKLKNIMTIANKIVTIQVKWANKSIINNMN